MMEIIDNKYQTFFDTIREYFADSDESIHKARNEVKVVVFENEDLVVKSFKIPGFIKKIIYTFFKDSKAKRSYINSVKIASYTPKGIGYKEFKKFGLLNDSYYVSEKNNYDFTIREPLEDVNFPDKKNIFKEFVKFTYEIHEKNIFHLDFSPGNILIKKEHEGYNFKLVDINRMEFKVLSLDERLSNLSKLWSTDEDMRYITREYALLLGEDPQSCIEITLDKLHKHKRFKNFKRRLKGKQVVA